MMKQTLFLLIAAVLLAMVPAQDVQAQGSLAVKSFKLLANDLTANSAGTSKVDQNGETCALIKVVTTETGFVFDIGSLGVTDVKQDVGEIWVYVPRGAKRITIKHPKLGILRDYYFNMPIDGGRTYELVLISGTVKTIVEEDLGGQYVVINVEPKNATVKIDGEERETVEGAVSCMLPYGKHQYNVSAPMCDPDAGIFEVGDTKVTLSVKLQYAYEPVTVHVPDGAQLFVDNQLQTMSGRQWSQRLTGGMHVLEARRSGYRGTRQSINVEKHKPIEIHLNAPTPILGNVNVNTTPANAAVTMDGRRLGTTPDIFRNILVGTHQLTLTRDGYAQKTVSVTVEEGKTASVNVQLEKAQAAIAQGGSSIQGGSTAATQTFTVNGVSFTMVRVEGGTFTMGATAEQGGDARDWEKPAHQVTLSSFSIGQTEVTQALWQAVMGSNPSKWKGDKLPVEQVSWDDCQEFIEKLNAQTGKTFRLPTEAEWEYAARGGRQSKGYKYSGSNTIGNVAWYYENSGDRRLKDSDWKDDNLSKYNCRTHEVATKSPNELGLYDMSGNVWEWCQDWFDEYSSGSQTNPTGASSGSDRVLRGGCWFNDAGYCRVSRRAYYTPDYRGDYLGLRLAL